MAGHTEQLEKLLFFLVSPLPPKNPQNQKNILINDIITKF